MRQSVCLGVSQRRNRGPVERTIVEYEKAFPTSFISLQYEENICNGVHGGRKNCPNEREAHSGNVNTCVRMPSTQGQLKIGDPRMIVHAYTETYGGRCAYRY